MFDNYDVVKTETGFSLVPKPLTFKQKQELVSFEQWIEVINILKKKKAPHAELVSSTDESFLFAGKLRLSARLTLLLKVAFDNDGNIEKALANFQHTKKETYIHYPRIRNSQRDREADEKELASSARLQDIMQTFIEDCRMQILQA